MRTLKLFLTALLALALAPGCDDPTTSAPGDELVLRAGAVPTPDDQTDLSIGPTIWTHVDPIFGGDQAVVPGDPDPDRLDPYALGQQARLRYEWLRAANLVK